MHPLFDKIESALIKTFLVLLALSILWQVLASSTKWAESLVLLNRFEGDEYNLDN